MNVQLNDLCLEWKKWSVTASRDEDGWESDFPRWLELIKAAELTLSLNAPDSIDIDNLVMCFSISSEGENVADLARSMLPGCLDTLRLLLRSNDPNVRWQVYDILGEVATGTRELVLGLNDLDPYCRRRALLALFRIDTELARKSSLMLIDDEDPILAQLAKHLHNTGTLE